MKHLLLASAILVGTVSISVADPVDTTSADTHPRVNEVNTRLSNQATRISQALAAKTITSTQAGTLTTQDAKISAKATADEAQNNGHLTKAEQIALNRQLNKVSAEITTGDDHPRVAEVDARLADQNARINRAETDGKIDAVQAKALHDDDAGVKAAETKDESQDGSITKAAKHALNSLLNAISGQISGDTHPRISQIDNRLTVQENRISRDEADKKITTAEATTLEAKDASIQTEEQSAASVDGGYITKAEQRALNQQISKVGQQVSSDAGNTGSHDSHTGGSQHGGSSHSGGHK